jgi:hypothetical protein
MKYIMTILVFIIAISGTFAQDELRAAMGINFGSSPSIKDYINQVAGYNEVGSFSSSVIFSGEYDHSFSSTYDLGLELGYLLNSYTFSTFGTYDFSYHILMPTVTSYYVIRGDGYNFKFGGGAGLRFVNADESQPSAPAPTKYSSTGFGFLLRVAGNTRLSDNFYAFIAGDLRYDLNGEPKSAGNNYLMNNATNEKVNLDTFSAGVNLGITYIF